MSRAVPGTAPQWVAVGGHPVHAHAVLPQLLQVTNGGSQLGDVIVHADRTLQLAGRHPLAIVLDDVRAPGEVPVGLAHVVHREVCECALCMNLPSSVIPSRWLLQAHLHGITPGKVCPGVTLGSDQLSRVAEWSFSS